MSPGFRSRTRLSGDSLRLYRIIIIQICEELRSHLTRYGQMLISGLSRCEETWHIFRYQTEIWTSNADTESCLLWFFNFLSPNFNCVLLLLICTQKWLNKWCIFKKSFLLIICIHYWAKCDILIILIKVRIVMDFDQWIILLITLLDGCSCSVLIVLVWANL